jgi:hypothetical protein
LAARRLHNVAPGGIESADELMSTVYAPQMQAISRIKDSCRKFAEHFSSHSKSKAEKTKIEPDFDLGIDPVVEEASVVEDSVADDVKDKGEDEAETSSAKTSNADGSKKKEASRKSTDPDQKDPKSDARF